MTLSVPAFAASARVLETLAVKASGEEFAGKFFKTAEGKFTAFEHGLVAMKGLAAKAETDAPEGMLAYLKRVGDVETANLLAKDRNALSESEYITLYKRLTRYGDNVTTPEIAGGCKSCFPKELLDKGITRTLYDAKGSTVEKLMKSVEYKGSQLEEKTVSLLKGKGVSSKALAETFGTEASEAGENASDRALFYAFHRDIAKAKDPVASAKMGAGEKKFLLSADRFNGPNNAGLGNRLFAVRAEMTDEQLEKFASILDEAAKSTKGKTEQQKYAEIDKIFARKAEEAQKAGDSSLMEAHARLRERKYCGWFGK
jgi:hypothetical protein